MFSISRLLSSRQKLENQQIRSTRTKFTSLIKITKFINSRSRVPTLHFVHSPPPLYLLPKSNILNPSTASTCNANWGLGFCLGRRQGGWEAGRKGKRGVVRRWLFWFPGGKWKGRKWKEENRVLWYLKREEICWGWFERRRILGWWKWKS